MIILVFEIIKDLPGTKTLDKKLRIKVKGQPILITFYAAKEITINAIKMNNKQKISV